MLTGPQPEPKSGTFYLHVPKLRYPGLKRVGDAVHTVILIGAGNQACLASTTERHQPGLLQNARLQPARRTAATKGSPGRQAPAFEVASDPSKPLPAQPQEEHPESPEASKPGKTAPATVQTRNHLATVTTESPGA